MFEVLKKQSPKLFSKNSQTWKENTHVFNSVYFLTSVNTSFQLSIYQVIFSNLKNLFLHCFSTFFTSHNLQFCSYIGKLWYIYVIGIKLNKKTLPLIPPTYTHLLCCTEFPNSLFIKAPRLFRTLEYDVTNDLQKISFKL